MDESLMQLLPTGWTAEPYGNNSSVLEASGKKGYATVYFNERGYCLGIGGYVRSGAGAYKGRGWQKQLVSDAIKALQDAIGQEGRQG